MNWDIDRMLDELGEAIAKTLRELDEGRVVRTERVYGDDRSIKVTTRVSIGPAVPYSAPLMQKPPRREPLIEVFDDARGLRVLVELPGVRKDDIRVRMLEGIIRIEVTKDGKVHRKDVQSGLAPGSIEVKSTKENNSVVELSFRRKNRG